MQMNTLTDDELRSLAVIEPWNLDALSECARRFVDAEEELRQEAGEWKSEAEQWQEDFEASDRMLNTVLEHRDKLQKQLDDLRDRVRGLLDA